MARIDGAGPTVGGAVPAPAAVPLPPAVALLVAALLGSRRAQGYQRRTRGPSAAPSRVTASIARPYQAA